LATAEKLRPIAEKAAAITSLADDASGELLATGASEAEKSPSG